MYRMVVTVVMADLERCCDSCYGWCSGWKVVTVVMVGVVVRKL